MISEKDKKDIMIDYIINNHILYLLINQGIMIKLKTMIIVILFIILRKRKEND